MAHLFAEKSGAFTPVTYVHFADNTVHEVRSQDKNNVDAVVVGAERKKRPQKTRPFAALVQFRVSGEAPNKGDQLDVSLFEVGDTVRVSGTSKGRGFSGAVKRHNFRTLRDSHGTKFGRHGSNSQGRKRPKKGVRMPGRYGNDRVTLRTQVVAVDSARGLLALKGPLPGATSGRITVEKI